MVKELSDIQKWVDDDDIIVDVIPLSEEHHPAASSPCVVLIKKVKQDGHQLIPIDCYDYNRNFSKDDVRSFFKTLRSNVYCVSKKKFLHLMSVDSLLDLSLKVFFKNGEIIEDDDYTNRSYSFFKNKYGSHKELNKIVPSSIHVAKFLDICKDIEDHAVKSSDKSYYSVNKIVLETLYHIEKSGLYVDVDEFNTHFPEKEYLIHNNLVYTEYNIRTSTGRPSNRFGGINFSALNKENECRKSFVSRHGKDGMLVMFDYSAYHPHIISKLINYEFDKTVNVYEELGKEYFDKESLSDDEIKNAKTITFKQLYGSINSEYERVPYFKKIKEYIYHRWDHFNEHGYVETPIFKRQISHVHLKDANPTKLFNYILQASETEYSMQSLVEITNYLENKKTKAVLYTYDSILFDVHKDDGKNAVLHIKKLMENFGFPTKCYVGNNYHDMKVVVF